MGPKLEETVYFDFITSSPANGAAVDADSTPTAEVFEDATDTAILTPTVTKRTSKTGNYRVPVACTAANGFEAGKSYNVVVSATVGGVAGKAVLARFQVRARSVDDTSTFAGGAVASVTGNVGGNIVGSVASVTGNIGGNVVGSVASVTAGVTLAPGSINAAAVNPDAEDTTVDAALTAIQDSLVVVESVANALDLVIVDDGAGSWEFTAGMLANAPSGGSAPTAADIWTYGTRVLTAGTNIVLAKGVGVTGFNDLSAAQVNAEADTAITDAALATATALAATKADTAAIKLKTDNLPASPAAVGSNMGTVTSVTGSVASVTGAVGSVTAGVTLAAVTHTGAVIPTISTLTDKTGFSLNLAQVGLTPRALDAVADASLTVGDALVAAAAGAVGKQVVAGTAYTIKTPSTGTVIRTFVLDDADAPASRT